MESLFQYKVARFRPSTFLKYRLQYSYFPLNFAKFLKTPFFHRTSWMAASEQSVH